MGAAVLLGALVVVLLLLVTTWWGPLRSVDSGVTNRLHDHAVGHRGWVAVNRVLTDWVWDPLTMRALTGAAALWLWWRRAVREAVFLLVSASAGLAVQQGVKVLAGRERPRWPDPVDSAHFAAFPSGHVMSATIACGALLWLLRCCSSVSRSWRAAAAALAVASVTGVSFTRVYLGVHWPTDLLGGVLLGGWVLVVSAAVCRPFTPVGPGRGRRRR